jgi:hypothetical protein
MSPSLMLTLGANSFAFRPSYAALVAAEAEVGSLFALAERASSGTLTLHEMIALVWHCRTETALAREAFGEACVQAGLAQITPLFRALMEQALGGV